MLAVGLQDSRLNNDMDPFVSPTLRGYPLKLNEGHRRRQARASLVVLTGHVHLAQFSEAVSLAMWDARGDPLEIAIMRQEDALIVLSHFGHDRIGSVGRQNFAKADNGVTGPFKKLADGFRHIIVREKPQFGPSAQAALW